MNKNVLIKVLQVMAIVCVIVVLSLGIIIPVLQLFGYEAAARMAFNVFAVSIPLSLLSIVIALGLEV